MKNFNHLLIILLVGAFSAHCALASKKDRSHSYPNKWWIEIPESQRRSWEYLPQDANRENNEVILSKRTELGIFSNFGAAPFILDNKKYGSTEGLWQMMKYPDPTDSRDKRNAFADLYPLTRSQVKLMDGFEAKDAGKAASKIMKSKKFKWVSYQHKKFNYKDHASGSEFHYQLLYRATEAKIIQNPKIKKLLLKTGNLKLLPDHTQGNNDPPSYKYYQILMDIRAQLKR